MEGNRIGRVFRRGLALRWRLWAQPGVGCALLLCMGSCGSYMPPYLNLDLDFDPALVSAVARLISDAADSRGWLVSDNSDFASKRNSDGVAKLWITVFPNDEEAVREGRVILSAGSIPTSLWVHLYDHGDVPLSELDAFALEVEAGLERVTGYKSCRVLPRRGYCDEPGEPLLRYKARVAPGMKAGAGRLLDRIGRSWPNLRSSDWSDAMPEITGRAGAFEALLFMDHPDSPWKRVLKFRSGDEGRFAMLELFEADGMSKGDLQRLAEQAIDALEARFGSPFCRVDPQTGLCGPAPARNGNCGNAG